MTRNFVETFDDLLDKWGTDYSINGGGICLATVCNLLTSTVADNDLMPPPGTNPDRGGFAIRVTDPPANGSTITNSIVWNGPRSIEGGWPDVACADVNGWIGGPGNIDAHPWFTTDYHLESNSPCIDAANDGAAPAFDRDGNPRYDVPNVGSSAADMGAYEYQ